MATDSTSSITRLLYSRSQAAFLLSISPRALAYLISERRIAVRRIGGRVLIAADVLNAFAAQDDNQPIVPLQQPLDPLQNVALLREQSIMVCSS